MSDWQPEHDAALRKHLRAAMTALAAAAALNREFRTSYTRNSVIGRARRIHVPLVSRAVQHHGGHLVSTDSAPKPKKAITPAQRPDIAIRKAVSGPKAPAVPFQPRPDPRPGQVSLLDLAHDGCRWPSGEGPYLFCNEPQADGSSYCGQHHDMATNHHGNIGRPSSDNHRTALLRSKMPSAINLARDLQAGSVGGEE